MNLLTWDTGIIASLGLLLAYSLLIRKHKSLATLVSVYAGYVMAAAWGATITQLFTGDRVIFSSVWIKANASPWVVQSFLLVLVAFLLSSFIKLGGRRARYSAVEVTAYAIATLALAVACIVGFMPPPVLAHAEAGSKILPYIYQFRPWIMVVPVFVIIFFGIYSNEDN
ncbi:MAG: hypothetical protein WCO52_00625 [bacterium]